MAVTATRRGSSKVYAALEGGPELARALADIDDKIRKTYAKTALRAGGRLIADEWSRRAPVGTPPEDEHPGAYRDSLMQDDALRNSGATQLYIRPGQVAALGDGEQPAAYAARLEFADAPPAARPAFDAARDGAADAMGESLRADLRKHHGAR